MKPPRTDMSSPPPALFYGVAIAALLAECAVIFVLQMYWILIAAALHAGAVALTAAWAANAHGRYGDRFGFFLLPLTAAAGVFGAGIGFLAALIYARRAPDAVSPADWIQDLFDRPEDRESDRLHERIAFGLDDFESAAGVEPFRDILSGGAVLQKQMTIAKIARYFRPAFAPLLLQAAQDKNAAVRVQAATALAKIERDFMARYIRLENDLRDLPDHDPTKLRLAELYDAYAYADLLDDNNRHELRQKAIRIYEACLAQSDNTDWRMKLARLYLRENQPEKSCEWLQPLVDAPDAPRGVMLWYMEALFQMQRFGDMRRIAEIQAPIARVSSDPALAEIENLLGVWEGTGVWEGKSPAVQEQIYDA